MTSKEALEILYRNCPMTVIREDDNISLYAQYLVEVITQDLERLEKLEKTIEILKGRICVHNQYICYDAYADIRLKDNEIELLKEVLEEHNHESCNI